MHEVCHKAMKISRVINEPLKAALLFPQAFGVNLAVLVKDVKTTNPVS